MKKNLYSLTLSDEVVREVDALAHRLGTNRSALVNRILSEYVSVPTPERRINDIFEAIEALVSPSRELVPFFAPNSQSMSLKSSLAYKYRPTVKYEVDLDGGEDTLGTLNVVFRTQSAELIAALTDFFRLSRAGARRHDRLFALRRALRPSARHAARTRPLGGGHRRRHQRLCAALRPPAQGLSERRSERQGRGAGLPRRPAGPRASDLSDSQFCQ